MVQTWDLVCRQRPAQREVGCRQRPRQVVSDRLDCLKCLACRAQRGWCHEGVEGCCLVSTLLSLCWCTSTGCTTQCSSVEPCVCVVPSHRLSGPQNLHCHARQPWFVGVQESMLQAIGCMLCHARCLANSQAAMYTTVHMYCCCCCCSVCVCVLACHCCCMSCVLPLAHCTTMCTLAAAYSLVTRWTPDGCLGVLQGAGAW